MKPTKLTKRRHAELTVTAKLIYTLLKRLMDSLPAQDNGESKHMLLSAYEDYVEMNGLKIKDES